MKAVVSSLLLLGALGEYANITKCSEYECVNDYEYDVPDYRNVFVSCQEGDDWYSKSAGEMEGGSVLAFCKSQGYDTVDKFGFQATRPTDDPYSVTDPKATTCNRRFTVKWYFDVEVPGSDDSKEHQTWKCANYPRSEPVYCCQSPYDFPKYKFGTWCVDSRVWQNNLSRCGFNDECKTSCTNSDSLACYNCCYALKGGNEWKCFDPPSDSPSRTPSVPPTESPSNPPTLSPVDPTLSPTSSPVDNSSPGPTIFDKTIAQLICAAAESKKNCKHALTKKQGKCKWKSGRKGSGGKCHLKHYEAPLDCESLTKRQCKKAKKKGKCSAGDTKNDCKGIAL